MPDFLPGTPGPVNTWLSIQHSVLCTPSSMRNQLYACPALNKFGSVQPGSIHIWLYAYLSLCTLDSIHTPLCAHLSVYTRLCLHLSLCTLGSNLRHPGFLCPLTECKTWLCHLLASQLCTYQTSAGPSSPLCSKDSWGGHLLSVYRQHVTLYSQAGPAP